MKRISFLLIFVVCIVSTPVSAQVPIDTSGRYKFWSETYPGIKSGEVFLTNISTTYYYEWPRWDYKRSYSSSYFYYNEDLSTTINFNEIGWETKRLGDTAYDQNGNVLSEYLPVFIKKSEFVNR